MIEVTYAGAITATIGLVQIIKYIDVEKKFERFYPLISLVIGYGLGVAMHFDWTTNLTIGLVASGVYDIYKKARG